MIAALPIKADTRGQLLDLDLPKIERAAHEDRRVEEALDAAISGEVVKRTSMESRQRELKRAAWPVRVWLGSSWRSAEEGRAVHQVS
jgi:hypothetical protein